jgi:ATP-dependent exoDNAse (exonuclease V) alpha subunit
MVDGDIPERSSREASVCRWTGRAITDASESTHRDKKISFIDLAQGDRIRFGDNLPQFRIRNGARGTIERMESDRGEFNVAVRLEDGRLIEERWTSLVREQRRQASSPPRISFAYAGTAYSVQGRTAAAAVLYISKPTDAREIYVGLTRHKADAWVIAERGRLEAAVQSTPIRRALCSL